eukprot:CAMPEP_0174883938 /NCGR_PEP_ID=MMETSP1114-20130205/85517_1 /TAXON_ID=312471 /ORGANISM="Neobodo designis, Strain CCAP 1951/1" /LENGTH=602 /DNA_ID=CAMNT_0016119341 /DNA_START=21 /DNA_END=1830 /DNA_ORIENTATION=-
MTTHVALRVHVFGLVLCVVSAAYVQTDHHGAAPQGHWAHFDEEAHLGVTSRLSSEDDSRILVAANVSLPLFGWKSTPLFVDSNGFLSPVAYSKCRTYCNYRPSGDEEGWPIVALYHTDLNPAASLNAQVLIRTGSDGSALVEFRGVPLYGRSTNTGTLTAQTLLLPNGTIVMRYKSVIPGVNATTGIFGTGALFSDFGLSQAPYAVRFDWTASSCEALGANCSRCLSSSRCTWCEALAICVESNTADAVCRGPQQNSSTGCRGYARPQSQMFYTQQPVKTSIHLRRFENTLSTAAVTFPIAIPLPFDFPFFSFPKDGAPTNTTAELFLHSTGSLAFSGGREFCSRLHITCPSHSVVPVLSTGFWVGRNGTSVAFGEPVTQPGESICAEKLVDPSAVCPQTYGIAISGWTPTDASSMPYLNLSLLVLLSASGSIAINPVSAIVDDVPIEEPDYVMGMTPFPIGGVVREGVSDGSSALVPGIMRRVGWTNTFVPIPGCPDCHSRGVCNTTTLQCDCDEATTGVAVSGASLRSSVSRAHRARSVKTGAPAAMAGGVMGSARALTLGAVRFVKFGVRTATRARCRVRRVTRQEVRVCVADASATSR